MRKNIKFVLLGSLALIAGFLVINLWLFSPTYMFRIFQYGESDVNDMNVFPKRFIEKSSIPYAYSENLLMLDQKPVTYHFNKKSETKPLGQFLKDTKTSAFLVIKNDQLIYEHYGNGYNRESVMTSFSSVKSIDALLIGLAIEKGYIKSENDTIETYVEEYSGTAVGKISIKQLLSMRSPIAYKEGNLWFGDDAKTYYMPDLRDLALNDVKLDPQYNGNFHYNNYHPLLLGLILERSTHQQVSDFFRENIWDKIGAQYDASWSLDSNESGFEKMESGLNFRAIDYAKIGSMLLHEGKWNGRVIINKAWLEHSIYAQFPLNEAAYKDSFLENTGVGYQYMWYSQPNTLGGMDFFSAGKYGQFIYVSPSRNLVIVRAGEASGDVDWWPEVLRNISVAIS